jgi:hypothetical protein
VPSKIMLFCLEFGGRKPAYCPQVDEALATFNGLVCDRAIASNNVMNELTGYLGL